MGTLSEAATRLGYLHDLGVTAVELLPLAEFAGDRSWGYNPAVPYAVEQAYGGPDGLKTFVDAAPTSPLTTDAEQRDGLPASGTLGIGPYTAVILSQDDC